MFTDRPQHLKTFDYLGPRQYFLTFCTYSRTRLFITADAVATVRTQMENPIRARLVKRIEDYPFSGSTVYAIEQILEAVQLPDEWYRRSD
jgi:hypothetical protein